MKFLQKSLDFKRKTPTWAGVSGKANSVGGCLQANGSKNGTGASESNSSAAESVSYDTDESTFDAATDCHRNTESGRTYGCTGQGSARDAAGNGSADSTNARADNTVDTGTQFSGTPGAAIAEFVDQETGQGSTGGSYQNLTTGVVTAACATEREAVGGHGSFTGLSPGGWSSGL